MVVMKSYPFVLLEGGGVYCRTSKRNRYVGVKELLRQQTTHYRSIPASQTDLLSGKICSFLLVNLFHLIFRRTSFYGWEFIFWERERDVISLTPVCWQSSAILCWGRISTRECCTWHWNTNKDHELTVIIKRTDNRGIKAFGFTWLLTTGTSFSRIICNLSVSKFVRATVLILPVQS